MTSPASKSESPWPHRVAMVLACATFPLIWVGGLVTTYDAGMAVPDWPNTYGYNLFLYPWQTWIYGPWDLFIEHGHRLFAATVGMLAIALVAVVWWKDSRRWVRMLSVVALLAVIFQGALGGMRVRLDEVQLAKIHGCFGPAFFALAASLAVVTSRRWRVGSDIIPRNGATRVQALAVAATVLSYIQLVLGAQLRHVALTVDPRWFHSAAVLHLASAGLLTLLALWLAVEIVLHFRADRGLLYPAVRLVLLIGLQLFLGVATWTFKYGWPTWLGEQTWAADALVRAESGRQATVTTAHVAIGSLILVSSLVLALRSLRSRSAAARREQQPTPSLVEALV